MQATIKRETTRASSVRGLLEKCKVSVKKIPFLVINKRTKSARLEIIFDRGEKEVMSLVTVDPNDIPDLSGEWVVDLGSIEEILVDTKNRHGRDLHQVQNRENNISGEEKSKSSDEEMTDKEEGDQSDEEVPESLIKTFAPNKQDDDDPVMKETMELCMPSLLKQGGGSYGGM
ncbi:hypothetical protein K7X08_016862 [Anisodus acutangulus]|uniref:Uncharacterized protein n=1 Tax=Anisodus acutangulus TaxID=402998 RepID=A0A9Q1LSD9_9SOLA|nr:hypothetical protein K7X08_016862 [Anisodus acutangulus]